MSQINSVHHRDIIRRNVSAKSRKSTKTVISLQIEPLIKTNVIIISYNLAVENQRLCTQYVNDSWCPSIPGGFSSFLVISAGFIPDSILMIILSFMLHRWFMFLEGKTKAMEEEVDRKGGVLIRRDNVARSHGKPSDLDQRVNRNCAISFCATSADMSTRW